MKSVYYLLLAISKQAVQHYCFELVSRPCSTALPNCESLFRPCSTDIIWQAVQHWHHCHFSAEDLSKVSPSGLGRLYLTTCRPTWIVIACCWKWCPSSSVRNSSDFQFHIWYFKFHVSYFRCEIWSFGSQVFDWRFQLSYFIFHVVHALPSLECEPWNVSERPTRRLVLNVLLPYPVIKGLKL